MKIFSVFIPAMIMSFLLQPVQGQKIRISGSGKGYNGEELKFFYQSDPVTKSLVPVLRLYCDTAGHFECEFNVRPSDLIVIKTGIYNLSVCIDSVADLVLKLPDFIARSPEEEQNSFFAETKAIPEVVNDPGNLNNLIRAFDTEYNPVFNSVADRVMYNIRRNEIPVLIEKLNSMALPGAPEHFKEFVRYRLVMLNQVANGEYPGRMEDSVLINSMFPAGNQAYIDLVEQMFTKYFRHLANGKLKDQFNHAISYSSLSEMKQVVVLDGKATNEQLAEYIIILNLFNEYFDSVIPGDKIIQLLKDLNSSGSSSWIRDLAGTVGKKLTALNAGSIPPEIKLKDESGKLVSLDDLKGRYILLSFAMSDNAFSVSEYGIIRRWISKYKDNLNVVTVLCDRNFIAGVKRLHNMGFNWIILDGSAADLTEYLYDVTMYPSFTLIDREGKISVKPCPFPSENLDAVLGKKISDENK